VRSRLTGDDRGAAGGAPPAEGVRRLAVAVLAGFAMHLAFPRPGWDLLGWVMLAPVLALGGSARTPRRALLEGWVAGVAFFFPLLRWLTHTMTTFSPMSMPVAILVIVALAGYLGLFWGGVTWALAWLRPRFGAWTFWLAPPLWVTGELLRTYLLGGFPWGLLGYVPASRLPVIQIAAWTGVYGVSALLVLVNTALAWIALERRGPAAVAAAAVSVVAVGGVLLVGRAHLAPDDAPTIRVALVQGNIPQAVKWDARFKAETLRIYGDLTRAVAPGNRLVVWPEAAVPSYARFEPATMQWLTTLAREVGVPLLVGVPDANVDGGRVHYLNSAFLLDSSGLRGRYDKMHLVPFGEYVPLKRLLFFVEAMAADIGDFTPGREVTVLPLEDTKFGTVVCYEVIFPGLFRRFVAEGASFMTNITNDAWFGDSGGPLQHLQMVPLRAVENRTAIVRAANTGVSAVVLPSGAIQSVLPLGARGTLQGDVPLRRGYTFYTRFGDVFAYASAAVAAGALAAGWVMGRRAVLPC
jgi:apolipoprotein N-acyltransferase